MLLGMAAITWSASCSINYCVRDHNKQDQRERPEISASASQGTAAQPRLTARCKSRLHHRFWLEAQCKALLHYQDQLQGTAGLTASDSWYCCMQASATLRSLYSL